MLRETPKLKLHKVRVVAGEGRNPGEAHMLTVGKTAGLKLAFMR